MKKFFNLSILSSFDFYRFNDEAALNNQTFKNHFVF